MIENEETSFFGYLGILYFNFILRKKECQKKLLPKAEKFSC